MKLSSLIFGICFSFFVVASAFSQEKKTVLPFVEFDPPPMIWLTQKERQKMKEDTQLQATWQSVDLLQMAEIALERTPNPTDSIFYEGHISNHPKRIQTVKHLQDMLFMQALTWVYALTGEKKYRQVLVDYLFAWVKTYRPTGNDVNENKLHVCFFAYDVLQDELSENEGKLAKEWLSRIALKQIKAWDMRHGSSNRHVKRIKLILTAGLVLERDDLKTFALEKTEDLIDKSLFADGRSRDLERRSSMHYHVDCVRNLLELALIARAFEYNLYDKNTPSKASLRKSVNYVIPYAKGELIHKEWEDTKVDFDRKRWKAGDPYYRPGKPWDRYEATGMLALASVFEPGLKPLAGQLNVEKENKENTFLALLLEYIDPLGQNAIQPYKENPTYWQYKGKPVVLLGGSQDDNLFQLPDLEKHLELMHQVGANYIRNTMSSRDPGNEQPFKKVDTTKYDLSQWNDAYWERFYDMLQWTAERDIIVQIEIWAFHDFYGEWEAFLPWNPAFNVNYTSENTQLRSGSYGSYWETTHDFFQTVPNLQNDREVLKYQQAFVDKILSYTLSYHHVLYCMTNEIFTQYSPEWGWYWADYIKKKAKAAGRSVQVAEMFQNHDLDHEQHKATLDHPEIYNFVDISQNSRKLNQEHWDKLQFVRAYLKDHPRPINHTKTYGGPRGLWTDGPNHGLERWWRNIIGGAASTRFHRPPSGIGLNERAQRHIKSMRLLLSELDIFRAQVDVDSKLLLERAPDEAYLTYIPGEVYAVYFPDGGRIELDLSTTKRRFIVKWLNIEASEWSRETEVEGGDLVPIRTKGGHWVVLLKKL